MTRSNRFRLLLTADRTSALVVSLIPFVYFFPAVNGTLVLAPDDGVIFNAPLRTAIANIIRNGWLPLWNPYIFSGMPLFGAVQGGVLFPPNWFYLIFNASTATNLMVLVSYCTGALGAYFYARRKEASIAGAITTSIVWQMSGFMVGQVAHINIVQTAVMMPWVLWAIDGFGVTGKRKWAVLISILVALQVFVGHPQTLVYSVLLATAYATIMALRDAESRRTYLLSIAFLFAGLLLAAVQILPTIELLRNSIRSDATYEFFSSFSWPRRFFEAFFAPYIMGGGDGRLFRAPYVGEPFYGEFIPYVGLLSLMLALVAITVRRDVVTKFWLAIIIIGCLLALGDHAPFRMYRLIYYIPILNLFRVPSRHLMELDFALAVLAGRGLTVLTSPMSQRTKHRVVMIASAVVVLLTILIVTIGRPHSFKLGRQAPVTLLRAPELFLPILIAIVSAASLWFLVNRRRAIGTVVIIAVLSFDLVMWGHFSGWYLSPRQTDEVWHVPYVVKVLQGFAPQDSSSYRILTVPHTFDPETVPIPPSISHSTDWTLWSQPDLYMMHGIHNAAGYDGFGMKRYSELAGDMKVWGELTDPNSTLRGPDRAMDLLNVRYLLAMRKQAVSNQSQSEPKNSPGNLTFQDWLKADGALGLPNLSKEQQLTFKVPPFEADRFALVTNLSWAENVRDGTTVSTIHLHKADGAIIELQLRAGVETAEWAHDRPDIARRIKHKGAAVSTSYPVTDASGTYLAHTYVSSFELPRLESITGGDVVVQNVAAAPDLSVAVFRGALVNSKANSVRPLTRDAVAIQDIKSDKQPVVINESPMSRWRLITQTNDTVLYENLHALPRAWLATDARALDKPTMLSSIRTGRLPDGSTWDPTQTALIEPDVSVQLIPNQTEKRAEVTRYEANRIDIQTSSESPSILVLSENHYPGWRAYVDGGNVPVIRVNYSLRGVILPAGQHQVVFVFRPKSVIIGVLLSLMTLLGLCVWWQKGNRKSASLSL